MYVSEEDNAFVIGGGISNNDRKDIFAVKSSGDVKSAGRIQDKTGEVIPTGVILPFYGSEIPSGWLLCDGREIPAHYHDLIAMVGDRKTPNLCGRTLIGSGTMYDGAKYSSHTAAGNRSHVLTTQQMPNHSHEISRSNFGYDDRSFVKPHGNTPLHLLEKLKVSYPFCTNPENPVSRTETKGGSQPFELMQPFYVINYMIKC